MAAGWAPAIRRAQSKCGTSWAWSQPKRPPFRLELWDVATWQELITLERLGEGLRQLDFSADAYQLTARNSQRDVLAWRVPSLAEIAQQESQPAGTK